MQVANRTKLEVTPNPVTRDQVTQQIIGAAIEVHRHLGPGLLESAYEHSLVWELSHQGLDVQHQVPLPVTYKGVRLDCGYRMDLIVDRTVVVEVKALETLLPIHEAQLLTYLRLSSHHTGLLLNFNETRLCDGVKRLVLNRKQ